MPAPTFDLQSHSTHSDGALSPAEVVRRAAGAGVELLALTDHDTATGVAEAQRAAQEVSISLVPATEISSLDGGRQDLHILGYLIEPEDRALTDLLTRSRGDRQDRARAMAQALRELGFELDTARMSEQEREGHAVGRPHLAQAVVSAPANRERLEREGLSEATSFLRAYLIEGRPAFVPRAAPSIAETVAAIHAAGGLAVWAHPFWDVADEDAVLETIGRFQALGLDGVEVFYPTHTPPQVELLARRCAELGLLTTGSSDFHGPDHHTFPSFRAFRTFGIEPTLGPLAG